MLITSSSHLDTRASHPHKSPCTHKPGLPFMCHTQPRLTPAPASLAAQGCVCSAGKERRSPHASQQLAGNAFLRETLSLFRKGPPIYLHLSDSQLQKPSPRRKLRTVVRVSVDAETCRQGARCPRQSAVPTHPPARLPSSLVPVVEQVALQGVRQGQAQDLLPQEVHWGLGLRLSGALLL